MKPKQRLQSAIGLIAVLLLAAIFFALIFHFDNKYTLRTPVFQDGVTFLSETNLSEPSYLADGWELWPGVLPPPDALTDAPAPVKTYVGRYLNLSEFTPDRSPYGVSAWRLRVRYDGAPKNVTLLLPEIFCAWKLYVNGEEIAAQGSLAPYQPLVRDMAVSLTLTPETELVLQTANQSHYYSGVTYPPMVGTAQVMQHYTGVRLLAYGFLSFGALVAAFFSAAFWLSGLRGKRRDPVALLFGGVAIGFAVYGSLRGRPGCGWMLGGAGIFAAVLFAGALTVSTFEPAQFFWFEEYGAFAPVCCFGILAVRRHYALVQENERLTEHLGEEVERKTREMGLLVRERDDLISKFLHDMRSPAAFMLSYAQMVRENNVSLDEHTKEQLAVIEEKCGVLSDRVHQVQQYTAQNPLITPRKPVELCMFLREFYCFNRPVTEKSGSHSQGTTKTPISRCGIPAPGFRPKSCPSCLTVFLPPAPRKVARGWGFTLYAPLPVSTAETLA